jgi:protein TonB
MPPPPLARRIVPHRTPARKREGAASPPNLKSRATDIVAPPPVIPLPAPPPLIAAPVAGTGTDPSAGASTRPGPGTGAGGQGTGTGSGAAGNGEGGGGAGTPSRWLKGRIRDSDYPRGPLAAKIGGTLLTRYVVGPNGRVTECRVIRSSGNAELDATTCRLIIERFRFAPARDAQGRKVSDVVVEDHTWVIDE